MGKEDGGQPIHISLLRVELLWLSLNWCLQVARRSGTASPALVEDPQKKWPPAGAPSQIAPPHSVSPCQPPPPKDFPATGIFSPCC